MSPVVPVPISVCDVFSLSVCVCVNKCMLISDAADSTLMNLCFNIVTGVVADSQRCVYAMRTHNVMRGA